MNDDLTSAASRARWLAALAAAIESAQQLAWQLGTSDRPSAEARELYSRLEAARAEVESLRGRRAQPCDERRGAAWLDSLGWSGALLDPAE